MARRPQLHTGPLWRSFLIFLLPLIAQNILQSLTMTINSIVVGQMLGTRALASMATFMPMAFFFISFLIGITAGSSVLIGQAWGAQKHDVVQAVAGTSLGVTVALGLVIGGVGYVGTPALLGLLGTPPDIMENATAYARASFLTMPFLFPFIAVAALLRGIGDSIRPLLVQIVVTVVSAGLTVLMVRQLDMGVAAAAISTGTAQFAGLLVLGVWLRMVGHPLAPNRVLLSQMIPDPKLLKTVLRIGLPTGLQLVVGSMAGLVIIGLVNSFGSDSTAAYGAVSQVQNYAQFPALSIAIAASIFGAQAIGAGRADRLDAVLRTAMVMNLALTGGLVALIYLFSRPLVALFISDPEVVDLAQHLLHIVSWSALLFGAGSIFSGIMRSSGTVIPPMVIAVASVLLVELPLAVLMSRLIGLQGIWWGYVGGFGALMIGQGAYYLLVWRRKKVVALV
ncbi:MATE family efflux transporter [Paracoccus sp. Z118]|uniref:MATE family efflux transporter n=1 Tax=Paracoccus sp. Z118 TaxID=2851017 RepID=UPI001C2C7B5F|nr:MATE family efflux transporter [Paracoccus sp. Z118]MBV0891660.1 MATE family efflux transporter [Paracoccus sp. Z118]